MEIAKILLSFTAFKKKMSQAEESQLTASEHRENLNERLKREFGFDLSEGTFSTLSLYYIHKGYGPSIHMLSKFQLVIP